MKVLLLCAAFGCGALLTFADEAGKPIEDAAQIQIKLAAAESEIKALRIYVAESSAWNIKNYGSLMAAYQACMGQPPSVPPTLEASPNTK